MRKIILLASLAFSINAFAQVPSYVPTNGLVGYWPFTGNANDESGNNNNGTVNGATLTTDRFGNINKAYYFDGISNYIQNSSIIPNIDTTTISCWVYLNSNQGGCYVQIGADYTVNSNGIGIGNGGIDFIHNGLELLTLCSSVGWNHSTYFANSQNWFHYVVVKKGNLVTHYINGINLGSQTILTPLQPSNSIYFGSSSPNTFFLNGKIDDVGVWDRELSNIEISNLYNANICYQNVTVTDTLVINTGITGFNPITYKNTIKVYPNPTNDHITIDNGNISNLTGYQIKITNSLSQQVFQSTITQQQFYVDLSTWTGNGIYFVHIIDAQSNTIDIKKIVLQ